MLGDFTKSNFATWITGQTTAVGGAIEKPAKHFADSTVIFNYGHRDHKQHHISTSIVLFP
jgi:hypothetical protein